MKRFFRNSALSIIALAATVVTVPAQAQSWSHRDGDGRRQDAPQVQASWGRDDGRGGDGRGYRNSYDRRDNDRRENDRRENDRRENDRRENDRRDDNRWNNRRDYDRHDDRGYGDYRGGYSERSSYVEPAPAYYGGDEGYGYRRESHNGRSVAIIGGSAAAGAAIGGAAGRGQGAVIGAVVGGVAGVIADQAVRHNDYR